MSSRLFNSITYCFYRRKSTFDPFARFLICYQHWTFYPVMIGARVNLELASFVVTSIQHVQFGLNHFAVKVYVGPPKGNDWFEKQTSGTLDISCSSWTYWFYGGLQFQLEHHLFPKIPRRQLRKVSPVVRDPCMKHNLPYRSLSFWEADQWMIRTLRTAA